MLGLRSARKQQKELDGITTPSTKTEARNKKQQRNIDSLDTQERVICWSARYSGAKHKRQQRKGFLLRLKKQKVKGACRPEQTAVNATFRRPRSCLPPLGTSPAGARCCPRTSPSTLSRSPQGTSLRCH